MSIYQKDIKILWAKAAGRCSMPECRQKLIAEASDSVPSNNILIGENCHIVGEKPGAARSTSTLVALDRDRYPNLILLCRNHHVQIDGDEKTWPIERLHQIKSDHEVWVESALTENVNHNDEWYQTIINSITDKLQLTKWDWISDNALRGILSADFVEGVIEIDLYLFKAIPPGLHPVLEGIIKNLIARSRTYVDHFTSNAAIDNNNHYRRITFYKNKTPNENYGSDLLAYRKWEVKCSRLLFNTVVALNEFANEVRKVINNKYFAIQGHFVVSDSMGVMGEPLVNKIFLPTGYFKDADLELLPEDQ